MTDHAQQASYAAQDLREVVDGATRKQADLSPGALLMPSQDMTSLYTFLEDCYQPLADSDPWDFDDTETGRLLRRRMGSEKARQAVKSGNISEQRYLTGRLDTSLNVSGLHGVKQLEEIVVRTAWICYLFGHMGNGKTDFALLLVQLWMWNREDVGPENVITNVHSAASRNGFTYVSSYGALKRAMETLEGEKLVLFDEASSHASGYSHKAQEVQKKLSPMMKYIRKRAGSLLMIGHTGKDVHPDVRRLATAVTKQEKKLATFYESVDSDTQEGVDEIFALEGIPATTLDYDTLEESEWSWSEVPPDADRVESPAPSESDDRVERDVEIYRRYHEEADTSQTDLGEEYGLTRQRVGQILKEVEDAAETARATAD